MRRAAVAAIAAGLLAGCGGEQGAGDAYRACERAVEASLRAPSTADFSGATGSDISEEAGGLWNIDGYVDAENGFGAKIRTNWSCTVRDTGDNWDLVSLEGV